MQRAWAFLCILFLVIWVIPAGAQEEEPGVEESTAVDSDWSIPAEEETPQEDVPAAGSATAEAPEEEEPDVEENIPIESDWSSYMPTLYSRGDQNVSFTLGVLFPILFTSGSGEKLRNNVKLGGTGSISYNYFFSPNIYVGGEIQLAIAATVGDNMLYIVPITAKVGYQFVYKRFEFPFSLGIGIAPQKMADYDYLGFFMKPQGSVFFRYSPNWSFGLNTAWWFVPQTPKDGHNVNGNFLELTLSARYHF